MKAPGVGIVGIGVHLPETIRRNDFWNLEQLAAFKKRKKDDIGLLSAREELASSELAAMVREEMGRWKADPFHGAVERHVADEAVRSSDMEVAAARQALDDAHLEPGDIDQLFLLSMLPDRAMTTNPAIVHRRLGLKKTCVALNTDAQCTGFLFQLQLGAAAIATGSANYVLLVQSALFSPALDYSNPVSTTFGDAASAVVLGRVPTQRGILAHQSFMDSEYFDIAILAAPHDEPWYSAHDGPLTFQTGNPSKLADIPILSAHAARDSIGAALEEACLAPEDVAFFTSHQPNASFNAICRRAAGLDGVRFVDTFPTLGAISSCVVPANLRLGRERGLLRDDDVAVVYSTGNGMSWAAAVLRWGR